MTAELLDKIERTSVTNMLTYCNNKTNIWLSLPNERRRYAYLKDYLKQDHSTYYLGICLVARIPTEENLKFVDTLYNHHIPQVHANRTCAKLRTVNTTVSVYQLSRECSEAKGIVTTPINMKEYNPVLVAIPEAIVNPAGTVLKDSLVFGYMSACRSEGNPYFDPPVDLGPLKFENRSTLETHSKVFVISQMWGENPFHALVENMPRLAFHLEQILMDKDVKVHVRSKNAVTINYLRLLGITEDRTVSGFLFGTTVYLPETSLHCGRAGPEQLNDLRNKLRGGYELQYGNNRNSSKLNGVLVRRKGSRSFKNFDDVQQTIGQILPEVEFQLYDDANLPGWNQTFHMWYHADVVIAPHGAGLSNLVLCKTDTVVVEFITQDINLCFMQMSTDLSFKYRTMMPEKSSHYYPMFVELDDLTNILLEVRGDLGLNITSQ